MINTGFDPEKMVCQILTMAWAFVLFVIIISMVACGMLYLVLRS